MMCIFQHSSHPLTVHTIAKGINQDIVYSILLPSLLVGKIQSTSEMRNSLEDMGS